MRATPIVAAVVCVSLALAAAAEEEPVAAGDSAVDDVVGADVAAYIPHVFTKKGKVDAAAYEREARANDPKSIDRMLGPPYAFYHRDGKDDAPTVPAAERHESGAWKRGGQPFTYNWGAHDVAQEGFYGSTWGQVLYAPMDAKDPGVDRCQFFGYGGGVVHAFCEPAWWSGSHPEPNVVRLDWQQLVGGPLGRPIGIDRAAWGFSQVGLMAFNGACAIGGGAMANVWHYPLLALPRNKVPMAICVSPRNEFAFAAIWDVKELKGQVAVLAIDAGNWTGQETRSEDDLGISCLPSWGFTRKLKLLGYVDLPGMVAPSAISCGEAIGNGGNGALIGLIHFEAAKLKDAAYRKRFHDDGDAIARGGWLAVASKAESKLAIVDLTPLFAYVREMCFTSDENLARTLDAGPEAKQWPHAFEAAPSSRPRVVAVLPTPAPYPTALKVSPLAGYGLPALAVLACMDGRVFAYDLGALAQGASPGPQDIRPFAAARIGRNPSCLAYQHEMDPYRKATQDVGYRGTNAIQFAFMAVCRGDREIDWLEVKNQHIDVYRRLRDRRLVDPVSCDQPINNLGGIYQVLVCDFRGKQVAGYRVGDVSAFGKVFPPADPAQPVEFTGAQVFPGAPYASSGSNVP